MDYRNFIESKIVSTKEEMKYTLGQWRFKDEEIVLVNRGTDESIDTKYTNKLIDAAALGSKLVIILPQANESDALVLASLIFVDKVIVNSDDSIDQITEYIKPKTVL